MTQRRLVIIGVSVLALLLGVIAALWFNQNLVPYNEEVWIGYGDAARRNPLYMADHLLSRLGRATRSVPKIPDQPLELPPADTLLLSVPSYMLTAAEVNELLAWVERGGHLLVGVERAHEPETRGDRLLTALATRSYAPEQCPPAEPISIQMEPNGPPFQVRFHSSLRLNGDYFQRIAWGQGQVTLLTDPQMFTNYRLDDHDHAGFLWALLQRNPTGTIWLQYRTQALSLLSLLWERGGLVLITLLLTVLAMVWQLGRRLGPIQAPHPGAQRRLTEHLDASARFLWRRRAGGALLQAARQYAARRWRHRPEGANDPALTAALADSDQPLSEAALLQTLQTLQRIPDYRP